MNFKLKAFYFIEFLSFGILGPYLLLYLTQKGFTGTQVGLLLGTVPILTVFLQPIWSTLSDILHKRRLLLTIACLGVSVSMIGLGQADSFIKAFLLSFMFAVFIAPITSISTAIALEYLNDKGKPDDYGLVRVWGSIAYAISSMLLASLFLDQILIVFPWIVASLYLLLGVISITLPEIKKSLSRPDPKDLKILIANPIFVVFLSGIIFIGATMNIAVNYQTLFLQSLNSPELLIGIITSLPALLEVPLMTIVPAALKRLPMRWLILAGAAILPIRWLCYLFVQSPGWVLPAVFLNGIATIAFEVVSVSFIDKIVDQKWRATGQGLYSSALYGIGPGIGLFIAGNIVEAYSIRAVWGLNILLGAVGLALIIIALWRIHAPSDTPKNALLKEKTP
jgi:MFS transporter, PPP family, 3-phenylpropionic acid transporter